MKATINLIECLDQSPKPKQNSPPDFRTGVREVLAGDNQLTEIPQLPGRLVNLDVSWNSDLHHLPRLPKSIRWLGVRGGVTLKSWPRGWKKGITDELRVEEKDFDPQPGRRDTGPPFGQDSHLYPRSVW